MQLGDGGQDVMICTRHSSTSWLYIHFRLRTYFMVANIRNRSSIVVGRIDAVHFWKAARVRPTGSSVVEPSHTRTTHVS